MRRLIPLAIASVLVLACQDHVGPPDRLSPGETSHALVDADNGGSNDHARWLAPIVKDPQVEKFGTFDPTVTSARLHVACFETNDPNVVDGGYGCPSVDWSNPANAVDVYEVSDGSLLIQDGQYHAQVELGHLSITDATHQTLYRLVATVQPGPGFDPIVVAFADLRALPNGRAKSALNPDEIGLVGNKLPATIRLDKGVIANAISDAIAEDPSSVPAPFAQAAQSYGDGDFSTTVVSRNEPTNATFAKDGLITAALVFDGDELAVGDDQIAVFIGEPMVGEEDTCGDAFPFEKSGCKRVLAVSLTNPEAAESAVTSGYFFAEGTDVEFCIASEIADTDHRPWELIKIDVRDQVPEFEVLPLLNGDACALLSDPSQITASPDLFGHPLAWVRHNVGKRLLDFIATPLYADHSPTRMGSTLQDLSDITGAILDFPDPELVFDGASSVVVDNQQFTRYDLTVTNWADYSDALFEPSPDLPPCGLNESASRTWVDIYDASDDTRIFGFCALGEAADLQNIWFGVADGVNPPASVYITLWDRLTDRVVQSNTVSLVPIIG